MLASDPERFTAAIVDLNLPDAPKGEVIPDVLASNIPVVVLTGAYGEDLRQQMTGFGVVDYVVKDGIGSYEYACELVSRIDQNRSTQVLIVDDDPDFALTLKYQLEIQRFVVLTASSGEEALEQLQMHPEIRLVFADYRMPGMDGFKLSKKIREHHGKDKLAIIGLSSSDDSRVSSQFLKSGANDFLRKSFAYEELLCRVNQNLELLDMIKKVQDSANRDYLTNLYNRRYFFGKGVTIYQTAKEKHRPLCAAMMDIDYFKKVNDTQGHDGGDAALKHFADLLYQAFPSDLVARFGGEEFCLLIRQDTGIAHQRLEQFRQRVENTPVDREGFHFSFTISIGLTDQLGESIDGMLIVADSALYQAKEGGRNRVIYRDRPMPVPEQRKTTRSRTA